MDFPVAEIALPKRGPHYPGERGGSAEPSGCHEGPRGPAPRAQSGGRKASDREHAPRSLCSPPGRRDAAWCPSSLGFRLGLLACVSLRERPALPTAWPPLLGCSVQLDRE